MGAAILLALAFGAQPVATLSSEASIEIGGRNVRLGDVARVDGTDRASELEAREIAMLPAGRSSISLRREALVGLVRRTVPGLAVRGGADSLLIRSAHRSVSPVRATGCFVLGTPVASGERLQPSHLIAAPCMEREEERGSIRFDRSSGAVQSAMSLPAGAYLGRMTLPIPSDIARGQPLTVVSNVGPARVERSVVALQSGRSGRRVFVQDADGQVFAAPVSLASGARR